jgi:hypothetical protein
LKSREVAFLIVSIIMAAVFGGLIGDIVSEFLPEGTAKMLFAKETEIGFDATKIDVYALSFTVGIMFRVNLMSVLFVILVLIYFRWWYI